jgi:hypothetical protein
MSNNMLDVDLDSEISIDEVLKVLYEDSFRKLTCLNGSALLTDKVSIPKSPASIFTNHTRLINAF